MVEILVALALGLFLLAGILQILSSGRATYRLGEARARMQESGRYAIQHLAGELRAGRSGLCRSTAQQERDPASISVLACALLANQSACSGAAVIGTRVPLGYSVAQYGKTDWLAGLPGGKTGPAGLAVDGYRLRGDVLVSWGVVGEGIYAQADILRNGTNIDLSAPVVLATDATATKLAAAGFKGGNMVMIADCGHADIFTISNAGTDGTASLAHLTTRGNERASLSYAYNDRVLDPKQPRAWVAPYDLRVHFICCVDQQTGLIQDSTPTESPCVPPSERYHPALCRWSANSGDVQPVVMDVADLRAYYDGRKRPDSRSDLSRYSDASELQTAERIETQHGWQNIYSTRIELLVSGGDGVRNSAQSPVADASTADYLGHNMDPDQRLYETFSATIANRARTLWYRRQ